MPLAYTPCGQANGRLLQYAGSSSLRLVASRLLVGYALGGPSLVSLWSRGAHPRSRTRPHSQVIDCGESLPSGCRRRLSHVGRVRLAFWTETHRSMWMARGFIALRGWARCGRPIRIRPRAPAVRRFALAVLVGYAPVSRSPALARLTAETQRCCRFRRAVRVARSVIYMLYMYMLHVHVCLTLRGRSPALGA